MENEPVVEVNCSRCGTTRIQPEETETVCLTCDRLEDGSIELMDLQVKNLGRVAISHCIFIIKWMYEAIRNQTQIPTGTDKVEMLRSMIESYDRLPEHAKEIPPTGYDMQAALMLIYEIVRL